MNASVIVLLVGMLALMTGAFVFLGHQQYRRRHVVSEFVTQRGMEYRRTDVHRLAGGYEDLAVLSAGHARRADNVAWGRSGDFPMVAFDFRYEVGHGLRRMTRFYAVVVVDMRTTIAPVLMWHQADLEGAPLHAKLSDRREAPWVFSGDVDVAARLAAACKPLDELTPSMQVLDGVLLLCCPAQRSGQEYTRLLDHAQSVAHRLTNHAVVDVAGRPVGDRRDQNVAKTPIDC